MKKLLIFEMPIAQSEEQDAFLKKVTARIENSSANDDFHILVLPTRGENIVVNTICPKVGL